MNKRAHTHTQAKFTWLLNKSLSELTLATSNNKSVPWTIQWQAQKPCRNKKNV